MLETNFIKDTDVIILEADGLVDSTHGYGYWLGQRLMAADLKAIILPLMQNANRLEQLPPDLPLVISGGMTEVTSDIDWIVQARHFFGKLIRHNQSVKPNKRRPILGVCFGAQLLAEAFSPGSVRYLDPPDIGAATIQLDMTEHSLFDGFGNSFQTYTFHYNQIISNDVQIISAHHSRLEALFIEAYEVPKAATYGIQFHPEFSYDSFIRLLETYRDLLTNMGEDVDRYIHTLPSIEGPYSILANFVHMSAALKEAV